jgi:hypothetical protein
MVKDNGATIVCAEPCIFETKYKVYIALQERRSRLGKPLQG